MTVQHQVRLRIDDVETDAIAARISMDSTMAPRTTGEIIVPASAVPADLDPRYFVKWVDVEAEAMTKHELCLRDFPWGMPIPLEDPEDPLSSAATLADLSTLFAGKQLRDFPYIDVTRSWRLHVRRVDEDFAGDTITLGLASAEAILQDFANPGGIQAGGGWVVDWQVTLPTTSILAAINKVLEVCALPAITVYPSAATSTSVDEALRSWVRGVTAWEKVLQLARSINAFPVPDDVTGGLELRSGSNPAPITLHDLYSYGPSRRLKGGSITRDRGASDFAVAVVPVAQLIPSGDTQARPLGASQKSAGSLGYAAPRPWRTKVTGVTASGAAPSYVVPSSSGIANAQAFEATGRGDTADLVIPIDLQINLKHPIDVYRPGRTKQRYRVEGLTYQWPADELTISGRPYVAGGANLVQLSDWWIP